MRSKRKGKRTIKLPMNECQPDIDLYCPPLVETINYIQSNTDREGKINSQAFFNPWIWWSSLCNHGVLYCNFWSMTLPYHRKLLFTPLKHVTPLVNINIFATCSWSLYLWLTFSRAGRLPLTDASQKIPPSLQACSSRCSWESRAVDHYTISENL